MGHHAEPGEPGVRLDHREAVVEQAGIAAELVDQETLEQSSLGRLHELPGADDAGDGTAQRDVGDQHHRHAGRLGEAHVGDIAGAQVDLGRAARALDQHQIGGRAEAREALDHLGQQARFERGVVARRDSRHDAPLDDDLGLAVGLRFQQHRVHVDARLDTASARLERLGAADFAAVSGHRGVVRHVLRLERAHRQAAPRVGTRQPGDEQRLADVRARALQHQCRGWSGLTAWQGPP